MSVQANLHPSHSKKDASSYESAPLSAFVAGARDSEKYFNPDITKVHITINGSPNRIYNNSVDGEDMWTEISRFFETKIKVVAQI